MSDSSGVSNTTSWTVLASEETVPGTLRSVEGMKHHDDPVNNSATEEHAESRAHKDAFSTQHSPSLKSQQAPWEKEPEKVEGIADLPPDSSPAIGDPQSSLIGSHLETHGQHCGFPKSEAPPTPEPDSFSDSYTNISSAPDLDECSDSLLTTELQEEVGLVQEEKGHTQDVHCEKGFEQEDKSDLEVRKATDSLDAEVVGDVEGVSGVRKRRGSLLAAVEQIGREEDEDDEEEFRIPQPREEENMGFSLNKCILGAVILLGLGTIFFSGAFIDLDDEGDHDAPGLRDTEGLENQEWLNPEVPPPPVDAGSTDPLNKLAEEDPQISILHAQLLAQKEELKVAQKHAEEGGKERYRREEIEKEHSKLKEEMASLPVLQRENEKMKKELESVAVLQKEVETLRSTVTELSHITAKEDSPPPISASVPPPSGQAGDDSWSKVNTLERDAKKSGTAEKREKAWKTEKTKQGKEWNKDEKMEWTEEGKKDRKLVNEWKKGEHNQEKEGKERKVKERKNEWKKSDKKGERTGAFFVGLGEAKPGKDTVELKEKTEKKHWKVENDWEKGKPKIWSDSKEWEEKEERKNGNERWIMGKGEVKGEEERNQKNERWSKKKEEWKGKDEKNLKNEGRTKRSPEWKGKEKTILKDEEGNKRKEEWKGKDKTNLKKEEGNKRSSEWNGKDKTNVKKEEGNKRKEEWKGNARRLKNEEGNKEKQQWKEEKDDKNVGKDRKRKEWKEEKDWKKKDKLTEKYEKERRPHSKQGQKESFEGEKGPFQTHRQPTLEQPDYWSHQRERLRHQTNPVTHCYSVDVCAQAEGLKPVTMPEFQDLLLGYLAKAEGRGLEASTEELSQLVSEFFRDGVFIHDQLSFRDFVEDVEDILEDVVEGENNEEIEEAMDGFEEEALSTFAMPVPGERESLKMRRGKGQA